MENITLIIAMGVLVEALTEYGQEIYKKPVLVVTVGIGILLAFLFNVQLFNLLGLETNQYADIILTGIIASRGSNYIYDIVGRLTTKTE